MTSSCNCSGNHHEKLEMRTTRTIRRVVVPLLVLGIAWLPAEGRAAPAGELKSIQPGETIHLAMPAGQPAETSIRLTLTADLSGTLLVEARSFALDTRRRVFRINAGGEMVLMEEDEDGGAGSNSRLTIDVLSGERYTIEVQRAEAVFVGDAAEPMPLTYYCPGELEVSAAWGHASRLPDDERRQADESYWTEVAGRADAEKDPECRTEILLRRVTMMTAGLRSSEPRPPWP